METTRTMPFRPPRRRGRIEAFAFLVMGSLLFSFASAASAGDAASPSDSLESYWGRLPSSSDSVAVTVEDRPKALWEHAVLAPYRIVTFPVSALSHGVGLGIGYLDVHRVPERIARLLAPQDTPFGLRLDLELGGLSGYGGGLTVERTPFLGDSNTLGVHAGATSARDYRLGLEARFEGSRGRRVELGAGYRRRPNVRYFGIGPLASRDDESYFHQEAGWVGAAVRSPTAARMHLEADLGYSTLATGAPGSGHDPATAEVFAASLPPNFGHHSFGPSIGGQWVRESPGLGSRPGRGGRQRLRAEFFDGVDHGDVRFWTFRGESQQFFTLWRPQRVLALRGVGAWMENAGSDPIPMARLYSNDVPDLFRGYHEFRWRDRGLALFTAEYRWPVWAHERGIGPGVDGYLLTDAGQVFHERQQLGWKNLTVSYGGGLRVESGHGFAFLLEYAKSDEGGVFRFSAEQAFQFVDLGFLHGREPVPAR